MAQTSLGPQKLVLNIGSSSYWGLIISPGQEADGDSLGLSFLLYEAILMNIHNMHSHYEIRKFPWNIPKYMYFRICFLLEN